ncbi:RTA1-domain-containing protein [Aspergillus campestris IBT 28561]|uniref:RTA1-domain-containing protein n=1 Tax=Aspergillus campestris (strain IBT 28561) TaxID=1392248 RepID=A0A2I1CSJ7_ASPC2|nr:RTA1-domain-containing protein [Aspergillus campestris IBT 28561]PKY00602.1 RTA1-domain-containing protein [Aspergillus campestris IBT 28561]
MSGADHGGWKAYEYYPSKAAAVVFIILFLAVSLLHSYQLTRTRTWFFIPMAIGAWFEFVGYIGRAMSSSQSPNWTIGPYVMQSTLLLVAPALFAASIYMELGRIITLVRGEKLAIIRVNWMTKIFVAGDVLRAGIMVTDNRATGENVIIGGLFVQIAFFGFFLISAALFQMRIGSHPTAESVADYIPWRKHLFALHASSILILIRSIFRVVEYLQGSEGYLLSTEVFIYVFDGLLMFFVLVIFVVIHPSEVNCLLGRSRVMTAKGGLKICEISVNV